jgi:DNA integrity scanning protein DisA with diadenylate cyclase activity
MTDKNNDKLIQIEEAIQTFDSEKLYESSIALYKALDYQSNKTERISPNNFNGFTDSFGISKNTINQEKAFVSHWKQIEFIFQVADSEITRVQSLFDTAEVDNNEFQSFLFFTQA